MYSVFTGMSNTVSQAHTRHHKAKYMAAQKHQNLGEMSLFEVQLTVKWVTIGRYIDENVDTN